MDNREQGLSFDVHPTAASVEDDEQHGEDNMSAKLKKATTSEGNHKTTVHDVPHCNGIATNSTENHSSNTDINSESTKTINDKNEEESAEDENFLDDIIETAEIIENETEIEAAPKNVSKSVKAEKKEKGGGALKEEEIENAEISDDDILGVGNNESDKDSDILDELTDSILETSGSGNTSDSICSELYLKDSMEQTLEEKENCKLTENVESDNKICDKHKKGSNLSSEKCELGKNKTFEIAPEESTDEMEVNSSIESIETAESDEQSLLLELSSNSDPTDSKVANGILSSGSQEQHLDISKDNSESASHEKLGESREDDLDSLDIRPADISSELDQSGVSVESVVDEDTVDMSMGDTSANMSMGDTSANMSMGDTSANMSMGDASANCTLDSTLDTSVTSCTGDEMMDCSSLDDTTVPTVSKTAESVICKSDVPVAVEPETDKKHTVNENSTDDNKVVNASKNSEQLLSKLATNKDVSKIVEKGVKKAKARKSFAAASNTIKSSPSSQSSLSTSTSTSISLPVSSSSFTNLTFNVKELEKQGVLDMPKPHKKKVDSIKLKQLDNIGKNGNVWETSKQSPPLKSPVKSPVKSPGKTENAFFKRSKLIKRRRRKGKKSGHYRLPGEKTNKRSRKKESEERQLSGISVKANTAMSVTDNVKKTQQALEMRNQQGELVNHSSDEKLDENTARRAFNESLGLSRKSASNPQDITVASVVDSQAAGVKQNALDIMTKNSKLSFTSPPSFAVKKAKKSVRNLIDSSTHRTLDSFLKGASYNQMNSTLKTVQEQTGKRPDESPKQSSKEVKRKRKATASHKVKKGSANSPLSSQEEKKRKVDGLASPPLPTTQLITLVPTGSPPIMPSSVGGSPRNIILSPGTNAGSQTIIQNGTLNGLPVFQIINGPQPPQLLTIAQNQVGTPGNPAITQAKGMPLLLAPVQMSSIVTSGSPQTKGIPTMAGTMVGNQVVNSSPKGTGMLKSLLTPDYRHHISNGQLLEVKQGTKKGSIPNGLYPVTPPKTPEESDNSCQETAEVSPGGTLLPDKEVIPLCTCKISGASFNKVASAVTYCQSLDSVDGKVMGCCNKVTNMQLVRPAVKIPFLAVCENHRKRLRSHHCCPGCGHYCTQGRFLQCKKEGGNSMHLFHEQCQVIKDGKNYCPHCGDTSAQFEVHLTIQEHKPSVVKDNKSHRSSNKARIQMNEKKTAGSDEDSGDESGTTEKHRKTPTASEIVIGPDRYSLERFLNSLKGERPKKFRHLPKCLYTPAYDNDLERVIYMIEDGHNANEQYDDLEGQGALHAAAIFGSLPIVHVLVQAGASVHMQDKSLRTPVMYAAENNHPEVVSYLVCAGAIINSKADDGMTALHYAAKMGHVSIIRQLLDTEMVTVDITDDGGWTPLIWAVEHKEVECVKLLLKRNSDPNLRDSEENTTLHWAAFAGNVGIAEMLLSAGCDLDSLNMHGDRPLHIAARQDHYECVVLFLARGADVEAKNNKGETPLECCLDPTSAVCLALKVNKQLKKFGAKHMGRPEKLLHRDLSKGRENIPIPCVNQVDDDGIPQDYLYVTDNIETTNLKINRVIGSLQSCQCKDDCSSIYCACGKNSVRCWYDKFGKLVPEFNMLEPPLIFECNRACECWTTCNNRVVQNGVMSRLQVFKTAGRGWGCRTLVDIPRGTFICEYIGEHISDSEADRREDDSYLFDLDNRDGETYCIDARKYGNIARFINHLCEPNLVPVKVFVDSQDLRFPRICLFASRDITAQEELGFDYGEKFWIIKWKQFTCTCGSPKCRYSTETIQKTLEDYRLRHEDEAEMMAE